MQTINLKKFFTERLVVENFLLKQSRLITRLKVVNVIAFNQMNVKFHYNRKYQSIFIKQNDYALIKLHKKYNIFFAINRKYKQQFVESFFVIKKIEQLVYRLIILNT